MDYCYLLAVDRFITDIVSRGKRLFIPFLWTKWCFAREEEACRPLWCFSIQHLKKMCVWMEFCFSTERTCLLPRVAFQRRIASRWAASGPPWVPCHLPTCTNTRWSPSTTKSPRPRSTRSLQVTFLQVTHPMLPRWEGPTSAAWVQSPWWSLHRTRTAQSSSLSSSGGDKTVQRGLVMDYRSRTGATGRWLVRQYLQMKINCFGLSAALLIAEYGEITTKHMNFLSNTHTSFMTFSFWNWSLKQKYKADCSDCT